MELGRWAIKGGNNYCYKQISKFCPTQVVNSQWGKISIKTNIVSYTAHNLLTQF